MTSPLSSSSLSLAALPISSDYLDEMELVPIEITASGSSELVDGISHGLQLSSTNIGSKSSSLSPSRLIDIKEGSWNGLFPYLCFDALRLARLKLQEKKQGSEPAFRREFTLKPLILVPEQLETKEPEQAQPPPSLFDYPSKTRKLFLGLIDIEWSKIHINRVLEIIGKLPPDKIDGLLEDALVLKTPYMNIMDVERIFEVFSSTPEDQRKICAASLKAWKDSLFIMHIGQGLSSDQLIEFFKGLSYLSQEEQKECLDLLTDVIAVTNGSIFWQGGDCVDLFLMMRQIGSARETCVIYLKAIFQASRSHFRWKTKDVVELLRSIGFVENEMFRPELSRMREQIDLIDSKRKTCSEKLFNIYQNSPFFIKDGFIISTYKARSVSERLWQFFSAFEPVANEPSTSDSPPKALEQARRLHYDGAHIRLLLAGLQKSHSRWSSEQIHDSLVKTSHISEFVIDEWVLPLFLCLDAADMWIEASPLEFFELIIPLSDGQLVTRINNIFDQFDYLVRCIPPFGQNNLLKMVGALLRHHDIHIHISQIDPDLPLCSPL